MQDLQNFSLAFDFMEITINHCNESIKHVALVYRKIIYVYISTYIFGMKRWLK
jgi:hypothetical protein